MVPGIRSALNNGRYKITSMAQEHVNETINILKTVYYKEEPVAKYFGIHRNQKAMNELSIQTAEIAHSGMSHVACDTHTGKVIGISLNFILQKDKISVFESGINSLTQQESQSYSLFYLNLYKNNNIFNHFNTSNLFEMDTICIIPQHRRNNLTRELLLAGVNLGMGLYRGENVAQPFEDKVIDVKPEAASAKPCSFKTRNVLRKIGFQCIERVNHQEVENLHGEYLTLEGLSFK